MVHVFGCDLGIGDVIEVWWAPRRDQIVALKPYRGALAGLFRHGAQIATFAVSGLEMTISNGERYNVISRPNTAA